MVPGILVNIGWPYLCSKGLATPFLRRASRPAQTQPWVQTYVARRRLNDQVLLIEPEPADRQPAWPLPNPGSANFEETAVHKMISFSITLEETTVDPSLAGRSRDWWSQAVRDLKFAEESINGEWHEWACFVAHQAAEMAVKALYLHLGCQSDGSVVSRLLAGLPDTISVDEDLVESAKVLDTFYIPTQSPDSHAEGAPYEHYGPLQSQGAIACATRVLEFVQRAVDTGVVTHRRTRRRK